MLGLEMEMHMGLLSSVSLVGIMGTQSVELTDSANNKLLF